jgi:hypothetical protein
MPDPYAILDRLRHLLATVLACAPVAASEGSPHRGGCVLIGGMVIRNVGERTQWRIVPKS